MLCTQFDHRVARCFSTLSSTLVLFGLLGHTTPCQNTVPAPPDHEVHPIWGGETRQVFSWTLSGATMLLTGEDGGRIRRSTDGGATWAFADTPDDYTQSVLDVWMFRTGQRGMACGRGGAILETLDAGATWHYYATGLTDANNLPATIWRVRFVSASVGFAAGLHFFKVTRNNGVTWSDVRVFDSASLTTLIPHSQLEFYCLDVAGATGSFRGAAGSEWASAAGDRGIALHTDAALAGASGGDVWWLTLDDGLQGPMLEPWDLEFVRASTPPAVTGYLLGGPGGNAPGRMYRTTNGGASWSVDGSSNVTLYGVAVANSNAAIAVGYSGRYHVRNGVNSWPESVMPSDANFPPTPGTLTAPMAGVHALGAQDFVVVGAWGAHRRTTDAGANWTCLNPFYPVGVGGQIQCLEMEWRLYDVFFHSSAPQVGHVVGQLGRIVRTVDGGSNWTDVTPATTGGQTLGAVEFSDLSHGVTVGDMAAVYYTANGGLNWSAGSIVGGLPATVELNGLSHASGRQWWAVGTDNATGGPIAIYSRDDGQNWGVMDVNGIGPGVTLNAVDFANANEGLVVGQTSGAPSSARAFVLNYNAGVVSWLPVSPNHAAARSLEDVALVGTSLATAIAYTIGNDGLVMQWNGAGFVGVLTVYEVNGGNVTLRLLRTNLNRIGLSPSGNHALIGALYDTNEAEALDHGWLIRFDGAGWQKIRAHTGEDIRGVSLTSDGVGFLVGNAGGGSASFDHGNVADAILLRYLAN